MLLGVVWRMSGVAPYVWNPLGDGLSNEDFPFAILSASQQESDSLIKVFPPSSVLPRLARFRLNV